MIRAWGITDKGAVRAQNQDSYYLKPLGESLVVAVVCDGMGGAKAGNVASSLAVEVASDYLENLPPEELLRTRENISPRPRPWPTTAVFS